MRVCLLCIYLIIDKTHFPFILLLTEFISFVNLPIIVLPVLLFSWLYFLINLYELFI